MQNRQKPYDYLNPRAAGAVVLSNHIAVSSLAPLASGETAFLFPSSPKATRGCTRGRPMSPATIPGFTVSKVAGEKLMAPAARKPKTFPICPEGLCLNGPDCDRCNRCIDHCACFSLAGSLRSVLQFIKEQK